MFDKNLLSIERIKTKNLILEKLKTCDKFGVVRPVGFGKSHIIMELCNELPGKKLIIEPRDNIVEYIKEFGNYDNTDFIIYNNLLKQKFNHKSLLNYDYIFLDEMHRSVTEKWGNILKEDLKNYKGKMIGFSATPERMDGKNPIELIFNNEEIEPLYLAESIERGILPQIKYISSIYEIDYRYYKNKALQKKLSNYDINTEVKNIFEEFIDYNKPLHIIVFVSRINEIEQAKDFMKLWINKKINNFDMHSKRSKQLNNQELKDFYNSKKGINILYSVNMFNEGIHLSNVDIAIFLRKTKSNIIYQQQLGRMISEHKEDAIVFDLVNNAYNLDSGYISIWENFAKERNINISNIKIGKDKEELKIYTRQEDLINLIKTYYYLTQYQKDFIKENAKNMTINELSRYLNLDTKKIRSYCNRYKIKYKSRYNSLNKYEQEYIIKNRNNKTTKEMSEYLKRSTIEIRTFLYHNNLQYKKMKTFRLSKKEEEYIIKNAKNMTVNEISNIINVKSDYVRYYCDKNNIKYKREKLTKLPIKYEEYIIKNAENMTIDELAAYINIDKKLIRSYCYNHNIKYKKKLYDKQKLRDIIINNIDIMSVAEIAKKLEISKSSVYREYRKIRGK